MPQHFFDLNGKTIFVAGHRGMVGSAVCRRLKSENCTILTVTRNELNLVRQDEVENWFARNRVDCVVLAAAKVGGIHANDVYPADFLYENLMIQSNVIKAAFNCGVQKLLFLGSSCIYPKMAKQPITEDELLTGPLEPTNEWYAIAKIAGLKFCEALRRQHGVDFISAMPTNLYGPGDNYDLSNSHVLPALIRKICDAVDKGYEQVTLWGTGTPKREFMHADDLADALVFVLKNYSQSQHINIGSSAETTITALAEKIAAVCGFHGKFVFDTSKPDGPPRKMIDSTKLLNLGWAPKISLAEGIGKTVAEFRCLQGDTRKK